MVKQSTILVHIKIPNNQEIWICTFMDSTDCLSWNPETINAQEPILKNYDNIISQTEK